MKNAGIEQLSSSAIETTTKQSLCEPKTDVEQRTASYKRMITACAQKGDAERAEQWLRRMRGQQLEPDEQCYQCIVDVLMQRGATDKAFELRSCACQDGIMLETMSQSTTG